MFKLFKQKQQVKEISKLEKVVKTEESFFIIILLKWLGISLSIV